MTAAVVLPLWALLLIVAATPLAGWLGARNGAKNAIDLCSSHWGCSMRTDADHNKTTHDLELQLQALHAKHPEILKARAEAQRILHESGEHPSMPEPKKP